METKPSAAAMRAAKEIMDADDPQACTQFDYEDQLKDLADLIDRETGLAELQSENAAMRVLLQRFVANYLYDRGVFLDIACDANNFLYDMGCLPQENGKLGTK